MLNVGRSFYGVTLKLMGVDLRHSGLRLRHVWYVLRRSTLGAFNTRRPVVFKADDTHAQLASLEEAAQPRPLPPLLSPYRRFPRPTVTVGVRPERLARICAAPPKRGFHNAHHIRDCRL